ncbi:MAG TPA: hypothetical protein VI111_00735 [Thermoleophilaceae bacterium]
MTDHDPAAYERRFRRAGLPLFIEGYSAGADVFTRAAPLLAFVFLGEMLGAIQLDWSPLANVAAALGGLAILVGAFGLLNLARRRPFWSLPRHVGRPELSFFVVVPALLPLIFGGQAGSAALTLLGNALLLALVYAWIGYGLFAILRWAGRRVFAQLAVSLQMLARAVPLLLVFALVLFINTEMWQVFSDMPDAFLALVGALFVLTGSLFICVRLPREVSELERDAGEGPPLERRQRLNVGLVMFVSQALQVLVVSVAIGAFFVVFGALAVGAHVREAWLVTTGSELLSFDLFGQPIQITEALLRVSGGIAAFSGVYYAIAVLTDTTYREEFLDGVTNEMRTTFRARAEYLHLRRDS